jgi:hypothetical protein
VYNLSFLSNLPSFIPGWAIVAIFLILGILFGIVLERSRFCFTTAFQETMEFRNPWILQGVFLFLGISAVLMSVLTQFGIVQPAIDHQGWFTVVGGFLFGVGIAMCGACASGQLFRSGSGYVANWMEFIGAGLGGIVFALFFYQQVEAPAVAATKAITIWGALGLPPLAWGIISGGLLILLAVYLRRFLPQKKAAQYKEKRFTFSLKQPWHPYAGAVALAVMTVVYVTLAEGVSMSVNTPNTLTIAWLVNFITQPFGLNLVSSPWFTQGVVHGQVLSRLTPLDLNQFSYPHYGHHLGYVALGLWLFIPITILGAFISSKIAGEFRLRVPGKPSKLLWYLVGGMIMGFGASVALGCNIAAWSDSFAVRLDMSGMLFSVGLFPGVWFGTRLDEWVAERIWGFGRPAPKVVKKAPAD